MGPGDKRSAFHRKRGGLSETRRAWVKAVYNEFILYVYPPDDERRNEGVERDAYNDVILMCTSNRGNVKIDLTSMTSAELEATRELVLMAFSTAQDVCARRDLEAFADETGSSSRIYRAEPQLVVRAGEPVVKHGDAWLGATREWATDAETIKQLHLQARSRRLPEVTDGQ